MAAIHFIWILSGEKESYQRGESIFLIAEQVELNK
jgi:hypothetical protein